MRIRIWLLVVITLWPVLAFVVESLNRGVWRHWQGQDQVCISWDQGGLAMASKNPEIPNHLLRGTESASFATVRFLQTEFHSMMLKTDLDEISTIGFINTMLDTTCSPSPLLLVIGFSPWMVRICTMHTVNLGLCFTVNGACLATLIRCGYFGNPAGGYIWRSFARSTQGFCSMAEGSWCIVIPKTIQTIQCTLFEKMPPEIFNISHVVFVAKFSTYILGTVFAPRDHDFKNLVATLEKPSKGLRSIWGWPVCPRILFECQGMEF